MLKGPQAVDWSGIRAAAVVMGVRAAARKAADNLPEHQQKRFINRVMQRCHREGWITAKDEALSAMQSAAPSAVSAPTAELTQVLETPATRHALPLSAPVSTGQQILDGEVLSKYEKRKFLADVVRTPVGKIDKNSPLCQEHIVTDKMERIKMPSKLDALAEDSKLAGDYPASGDDPAVRVDVRILTIQGDIG